MVGGRGQAVSSLPKCPRWRVMHSRLMRGGYGGGRSPKLTTGPQIPVAEGRISIRFFKRFSSVVPVIKAKIIYAKHGFTFESLAHVHCITMNSEIITH